jgi:hypothetical protein
VAPLALLALVFGRKKKRGKWDGLLIALVMVAAVGMSLTACSGSSTVETPTATASVTATPAPNGAVEATATITQKLPAATGTPTTTPTITCTATLTKTPEPTVDRWDELWNLIQFVDIIDEYKTYFTDAVVQVANAFGRTLGKDPITSFISIFRLSVSHKLKFQVGACPACNGAGGYTHSAWWIEFAVQNPFYDPSKSATGEYNRTPEMAHEMNVHNVVHELGHAFANLWAYKDEMGKQGYVTSSPYTASYPYSEFLTNEGFKYPGPDYQPTLWRMHPDKNEDDIIRHREAFADMFLSWVYNGAGFDDTTWGTKRRDYMNEHMPLWLAGNPPFPSNN